MSQCQKDSPPAKAEPGDPVLLLPRQETQKVRYKNGVITYNKSSCHQKTNIMLHMAYKKNVKYLSFSDPERSRSLFKILEVLILYQKSSEIENSC